MMVSKTREDIMPSVIPRDFSAVESGEGSNGSALATDLEIRGRMLGALLATHSSNCGAVYGVISVTYIGAATFLE